MKLLFRVKKNTLFALLILITVFIWKVVRPFDPNSSFENKPPVDPTDSNFYNSIEEFFTAGSNILGFSGYVLIMHNHKVWEKGYGQLSPTDKSTPSAETIFQIGSVTKPITALAILEAESNGLLSTKDTVCKYLKSFCSSLKQDILILDLLNHTAGLPHDFDSIKSQLLYFFDYQFQPHSESIQFWDDVLSRVEIDRTMKGKARYSNLGYIALGRILEITYKTDYGTILNSLFQRLKMKSSFFENNNPSRQNLAIGMKSRRSFFLDKNEYSRDNEISYSSTFSAGAIATSAIDLQRFLLEINSPQVFSTLNWTLYRGSPDQGEASIWVNEKKENGKLIRWHNGSVAGFYTFVATLPEDNLHIVVLSNTHRRSSKSMMEFFDQIPHLVSQVKYRIPRND